MGADDNFMKELGARLQPGGAALIVLGQSEARDKVIERVAPYGGDVIQTSLSQDAEDHLRAALAGAAHRLSGLSRAAPPSPSRRRRRPRG